MLRLFSTNRCPICKNETTHQNRLPRKVWMRIIPLCRYYRCPKCGRKFLALLGFVTVAMLRR